MLKLTSFFICIINGIITNRGVDMTLINCKECNNKISHEAYSCPKCGWPVNDKYVKETLEKLRKEEEKKQRTIDKLLRKYFEDFLRSVH